MVPMGFSDFCLERRELRIEVDPALSLPPESAKAKALPPSPSSAFASAGLSSAGSSSFLVSSSTSSKIPIVDVVSATGVAGVAGVASASSSGGSSKISRGGKPCNTSLSRNSSRQRGQATLEFSPAPSGTVILSLHLGQFAIIMINSPNQLGQTSEIHRKPWPLFQY